MHWQAQLGQEQAAKQALATTNKVGRALLCPSSPPPPPYSLTSPQSQAPASLNKRLRASCSPCCWCASLHTAEAGGGVRESTTVLQRRGSVHYPGRHLHPPRLLLHVRSHGSTGVPDPPGPCAAPGPRCGGWWQRVRAVLAHRGGRWARGILWAWGSGHQGQHVRLVHQGAQGAV